MLTLHQFLKKGDTTDKSNYRPISTLSNFSKILEKPIYSQVNSYMESKLSRYLVRFCRNHNTQQALLRMIKSCHVLQNKGEKVRSIIMDLSKAFDNLNHTLLFKKLQAYGFNIKITFFYWKLLYWQKTKTKIVDSLSKYQIIIRRVPKGSILGLLFFNISINDLFLSIDKSTLLMQTLSLISWSRISRKYLNDSMKILEFICYFLTFGFQDSQPNFSYDKITIKQSKMDQKKKTLLLVVS